MPSNLRHFVGVSETGELLDDAKAFAFEEELMSDKYGMASPDTAAIPYLVRGHWGRPLRRIGWRHVMRSVAIGRDSVWLGRQATGIWKAARTSVHPAGGPGLFSDRKLGIYALAASVVFLFAVLAVVGSAGEPEVPPAPAAVEETVAETGEEGPAR